MSLPKPTPNLFGYGLADVPPLASPLFVIVSTYKSDIFTYLNGGSRTLLAIVEVCPASR